MKLVGVSAVVVVLALLGLAALVGLFFVLGLGVDISVHDAHLDYRVATLLLSGFLICVGAGLFATYKFARRKP
jgi:hypothetical protein